MRKRVIWVGAALLWLVASGRAEDLKQEQPRKALADGFLLSDLTQLTAAGMMQAPHAPKPAPASAAPPSLWTIGGYAEFGYTYNFNRPENFASPIDPLKENNFRVFDVNHNEFMIHSVSLSAAKAASDSSPVGFGLIAMAGQDAKWIHSAGLFDPSAVAPSGGGEDFDLIDAYLSLKIPENIFPLGTTLSLGKWQTMHGAEVIAGPSNPNYSRSYLFGFAIPFTHTGLKFETVLLKREGEKEAVGLMGAIVNGWDNVKDNNDDKSYMAMFRFQPADAFKASAAMMFGPEQTQGVGGAGDPGDWRNLIDLNATLEIGKIVPGLVGLSLTGNVDYGWEEDVPTLGYSKWYGVAGYLRYDFVRWPVMEKWHLVFRGEWFEDADGFRTGLGARTDFIGLTTTLGWRPWESLLVRFEHRYDKADADVFDVRENSTPKSHQNTVAVNVIVFY